VVLPVFEEQAVVRTLIPDIVRTLQAIEPSFEVVAVDDGSKDGTLETLSALRREHPDRLWVAHHAVNRGNGAALRTGIRLARGEIVITMDADGQHLPGDIPRLLEAIPPSDLVIAARTAGYRGGFLRGLANAFYNRFASWLARRKIDDLTSGFRAMRREAVLHFLPLFPEGFSAPTTTTLAFLKAGYNVTFVPIPVGRRTAGKSKIRPWEDGSRFVMLILRMTMLYDPLRIFLPMGVGLSVLGVAAWAAGWIQAQRLVFPNSAIFLFSAAILVWLLGFISDQISSTRIHYHGDETVSMVDGDP
jgi:glycosyltransferase involved in cell wall biosynthesis